MVLMHLDIYAQALATTNHAETAAVLAASVAEQSPHLTNPISIAHAAETTARLLSQLGDERLAELTTHGATLNYDQAIALAFPELDRVITNDNQP